MAEPGSQIFVVANASDASRIAGWLRDDGLPGVRVGDGGDDTLAALGAAPVEVIVLDAGIRAGDAMAFATALRASEDRQSRAQLVLIADEEGHVRHALDAVPFHADRFLRRPLSRAALLFAVKSCVQLGRADVAAHVRGGLHGAAAPGATAAAFAVLGEIAPAPRADRDVGGVAVNALAARIEEATTEAVEAYLSDKLEEALSVPPVELGDAEDYEEYAIGSAMSPVRGPARRPAVTSAPVDAPPRPAATFVPDTGRPNGEIDVEVEEPVDMPVDAQPAATAAGYEPAGADEEDADGDDAGGGDAVAEFDAAARMPPVWRDPTVVLAEEPPANLATPDEGHSGTFVTALREHMSAVEERLFGAQARGAGALLDEGAPPDIDLDAIGMTHVTPPLTDEHDGPPLPPLAPEVRAPVRLEPRPPIPGDLAAEDVASVFGRVAREGWSGRVTFRQGDAEKMVLFDDGRPIFASSSLAHDRMGELLVREGKITRDQITRASDVVTQSGRRMGEILVDLGYLKRRELLPAVRRHVEDILYSLFSWETGSTSAVAGGTGREEKIRLAAPPAAIVVEGIRRKVRLERLRRLLGPRAAVLVPDKPGAAGEALADAELAPEERQTVELFDGERSLGDVLAAAPLPEEHVLQLAWAMVALGGARARAEDTTAVRAPASSSWSGVIVADSADATIDRERILAKHAHVREADYFLVLGVRRDASAFEIHRAYEAARRAYAVDGFDPLLQRELANELGEIAVVLGEAYRVLHTDTIRTSYLAHLKE